MNYRSVTLMGALSLAGLVTAADMQLMPQVVLADGRTVTVTAFGENGAAQAVPGNPKAARLSEREERRVMSVPNMKVAGATDVLALEAQMYTRKVDAATYARYSLKVTNKTDTPVALDALKLIPGKPFADTTELTTIGNTDGAVIRIDCVPQNGMKTAWFAVEHPMARYRVDQGGPARSESVKPLTRYAMDTARDGATKTFDIPVSVTGETVTLTPKYEKGNLRLDLFRVDAVEPATGKMLAFDEHTGFTGGAARANAYTLKGLPKGATLLLRLKAGLEGNGTSEGRLELAGATAAEGVTLQIPAKAPSLSATVPINDVLAPGASMTFTAVWGAMKPGEEDQFRRAFAQYLNAERAHPHRMLPHYNSWYDLCINRNDRPVSGRFTREEALKSMRAFRTELYEKRGVFINSYLWDDGWDEWNSLWGFNTNYPNGFRELADEAHKVPGASISCWMSPFGGYGGSCGRRIDYAKRNGIIDRDAPGLQLSKPTYYKAFSGRVLQMIRDYDMNLFKFDRMGSGSDANGAADRYAADLRAVGNLCAEMRAAKQDVFINCTVGTWASPFWLMWCDSIWKGDNDCSWTGNVGTARQKWVTYRDNIMFDRIFSKSPLFPLNSMMMHGIIVCPSSPHNTMRDYKGTGNYEYKGEKYATPTACADFAAEVWMGMALGTGLQEYYISPNLMSDVWWDILANGVKWVKANESVLTDAHWIGGDPADGRDMASMGRAQPKDIYGYAALGKTKGIVMLRNPSDKPQKVSASVDGWLEMPKARRGAAVKPTVIFNSTAEFENTGKPGAFVPTWPKTTAETVTWELPPFATFLFEVELPAAK